MYIINVYSGEDNVEFTDFKSHCICFAGKETDSSASPSRHWPLPCCAIRGVWMALNSGALWLCTKKQVS